MKKQIKRIGIVLCVLAIAVGACYFMGLSLVVNAVDTAVHQVKALVGIEEEIVDDSYVPPEGATQVTGMVLTAYGNEITVQLEATSASSDSGTQGGMTEGGMSQGEMPEGMTEGEMSQGEMPEGMTEGGMTQGEMPEGMTEGEMPEGMTQGGSTQGGGTSERGEMGSEQASGGGQSAGGSAAASSDAAVATVPEQSGTTSSKGGDASASGMGEMSGEMSSGMGEMSGEMSGGMGGEMSGGMSGGMGSDTATVDYSSIITLGDETQLYVIPTGTTVEYYGFEMTFSQLAAEQYITITLNEDGVVLYVEVLG